jgi:hypothetical protein
MSGIFVRFTSPGFHRWEGAPSRRAYLRDTHRHLFHFEVEIPVSHDDREIEFHDLMDYARALPILSEIAAPAGVPYSCEHIAQKIARSLVKTYGRKVVVRVSEDGECGAVVSLQPSSEIEA